MANNDKAQVVARVCRRMHPAPTPSAAIITRCRSRRRANFSITALILRGFFPNYGEKRLCRIKTLARISQLNFAGTRHARRPFAATAGGGHDREPSARVAHHRERICSASLADEDAIAACRPRYRLPWHVAGPIPGRPPHRHGKPNPSQGCSCLHRSRDPKRRKEGPTKPSGGRASAFKRRPLP